MRRSVAVSALLLLTTAAWAQPAPELPPVPPPPGYGAPPPADSAPPPGPGAAAPPGYGAPPAGYGAPPAGYGAPPAGPGAPARPGRMTMRDRFEAANTTHDGKLTLDQAQAARLFAVAKNFSAIDADHKGYVTLQDVRSWMKARRAARMGQMPPQGQMPPPGGPPPPPPGAPPG